MNEGHKMAIELKPKVIKATKHYNIFFKGNFEQYTSPSSQEGLKWSSHKKVLKRSWEIPKITTYKSNVQQY